MGVSLSHFLNALYWIVGILTIGVIAVFIIRLIVDAKNTLERLRKRILRALR